MPNQLVSVTKGTWQNTQPQFRPATQWLIGITSWGGSGREPPSRMTAERNRTFVKQCGISDLCIIHIADFGDMRSSGLQAT